MRTKKTRTEKEYLDSHVEGTASSSFELWFPY